MDSNNVMKDTGGVIVARVLMTIFLTVFIGLMCMTISVRSSIFSVKSWREFFTSEETLDVFMESADIDEITEDPILEGRIDKDFFRDYARLMLDEVFDAVETGDTEVDEDALDDIYDEYLEDLIRENAPRSDRDRLKYEFFDVAQESVDDVYDGLEETGFCDYMHRINAQSNVFIAVLAFFSIGLIVAMLIISKEKFAALRNTGIALAVSEAFNSLIVGGLGALIQAAINSADASDSDEEIMELLASFFGKLTTRALTILIVGFVVGIVFIVSGEILRRHVRKVNAAE
ncbi:MAG: hypothetical protein MJ103_09330 [Saccharofermentans sp.]|nr:hypothetical protein [Saccharofermentans sp.]